MGTEVRVLRHGDDQVLTNVAADVFDHAIDLELTAEFLADKRHHIAVAIENGRVVGFASGVHYIHPDKRPELWINEVGVAPEYRQHGLGKELLEALLELGKALNCTEAWVLTERENRAAMALYSSAGGKEGVGHGRDLAGYTFTLTQTAGSASSAK